MTWANPGNGLAIIQCESDGPTDPVNDLPESQGGVGGICTADSGYATPGGFPPVNADEPSVSLWGEVTPFFTDPGAGTLGPGFFIRIGNNNNACTGAIGVEGASSFLYQELLAFWLNNGHVTFFIDEPGSAGGYTGTTGGTDPGTGYCDGKNAVALGGVGVAVFDPVHTEPVADSGTGATKNAEVTKKAGATHVSVTNRGPDPVRVRYVDAAGKNVGNMDTLNAGDGKMEAWPAGAAKMIVETATPTNSPTNAQKAVVEHFQMK